ncbi:HelD family protein [Paenibacillus methanolicus]|uniref:DNA helicase-2/ATP-dependent DNA helicase PcrA n=1 Tax=Paenibacillus methanolicus TaxID=582686 RepID=A0A5S5CDX7_9BACL|nr:3'-5' exonuclease [Paenibacillus methanolicus]TYP77547.1 DNA helicase-2/ATP-dependent DNA helicase PcrA [Paenibacillus methanolicus]
MNAQSAFQHESKRLEDVLGHIGHQLGAIGPRYTGSDFTEQMIDLQNEQRRERLEVSKREPYFGRLDFQESLQGDAKPLYIGKAGVAHEKTNELLVVDWRAPVASLFYAFSGGEAPVAYESPDGTIEGVVHLKRNLMVRESALERLVDSYVRGQEDEAVTDEFLLYRLGESKDNKLRDIVSTIQHEQDRIIRTEKNKAVFIQGVAGSGKTTVALHRLAFLLYQYAGRIRAERMVIFAPNRMFLDYISGVLPELGVGDILQTTYTEWALETLQNAVRMDDSADALAYWFEHPRTREQMERSSGRLKGSLRFKEAIDAALADIETRLLPEEPFEPMDRLVLSVAKMREWLETDESGEPLMRRRERLVSRLKRWFESEWKARRFTDKKIKTKATSKLNAYAKKIPSYTAEAFYASLMDDETVGGLLPASVRTETKKRVKKGLAAAEDLAPLVYIHLRLFGTERPNYDHIVIDEAQDYSPFQLESLRLCQRQPSMTVLGDLQQGIHGYAGIHSWRELSDLFEADERGYFELDRSYRSTMEIIEFANHVLRGMGDEVKPAVPVFRSGEPVDLIEAREDERLERLTDTVKQWQGGGAYKTIAVLGRTAAACEAIGERLAQAGLAASVVRSKQEAYGGGLTVVPVYLAKGLEFDAVIIADADAASYGSDDAKLLYVGCTRALHKLTLFHSGPATGLIDAQAD